MHIDQRIDPRLIEQHIVSQQITDDIYNDNIAHTPEPNSRSKIHGSTSVKNMHPMASLTQPLFSQRRKPSNTNVPGNPNNTKDAHNSSIPQHIDTNKIQSMSNGMEVTTGQIISSTDSRIPEAQMTNYSSVNSYGRAG